jgi:hypothetical protein
MLGVLVTAGAAICLAPCGSALAEWNLGQAIDAVTGTRLWAFVFSLPGTVLIFVLSFVLRGCHHGRSAVAHGEQEKTTQDSPIFVTGR